MKKATAILSALLVAVMMMAASVCAAEINLIPEDADWVMTEAGGSGASWSYGENGLTVKDNGAGWPRSPHCSGHWRGPPHRRCPAG